MNISSGSLPFVGSASPSVMKGFGAAVIVFSVKPHSNGQCYLVTEGMTKKLC